MQNIQLEAVKAMDPHALKLWVAQCETNFERQFAEAFDLILKENIRTLFLAGPSCSGKTTATMKLAELLKKFGKTVITVSTDDFFLDNDLAPKNRDGTPNFESFDFIDSDMLLEVVGRIRQGREYFMPRYDFNTRKRIMPETPSKAAGDEVILVEGIHALNDKFLSQSPDQSRAGVYICPAEAIALNSRILLEKDDIRFIRRLVRDRYHRNTPAMETFRIWQNVLEGEDLFITPFIKNADICINSTFSYEPFIIRDQAITELSQVPPDSMFRFKASSLSERLNRLISLPVELVPADSLLNEFLK